MIPHQVSFGYADDTNRRRRGNSVDRSERRDAMFPGSSGGCHEKGKDAFATRGIVAFKLSSMLIKSEDGVASDVPRRGSRSYLNWGLRQKDIERSGKKLHTRRIQIEGTVRGSPERTPHEFCANLEEV